MNRNESVGGTPSPNAGNERVAYDPDPVELRSAIGDQLPDTGESAEVVMERLKRTAAPGLVDTTGPRYFGFVVGGALPAAVTRPAGLHVAAPLESC